MPRPQLTLALYRCGVRLAALCEVGGAGRGVHSPALACTRSHSPALACTLAEGSKGGGGRRADDDDASAVSHEKCAFVMETFIARKHNCIPGRARPHGAPAVVIFVCTMVMFSYVSSVFFEGLVFFFKTLPCLSLPSYSLSFLRTTLFSLRMH